MENISGNGPNIASLEKLKDQLKGMAKAVKAKVKHRTIHPGPNAPRLPRQLCLICNQPFDFIATNKGIIPNTDNPCGDCRKFLDEGYTALVSPNHHAFVRSPKFNPGKVLRGLKDETLLAVKEKMKPNEPQKPADT